MPIIRLLLFTLLLISTSTCAQKKSKNSGKSFTKTFNLENCSFITVGRNDFFILEPGYQLFLEGKEDGKPTRLIVTVLNETKKIGNIDTRIVEENESVNGQTIEISRNFFAFCKETGSIYYFGEDVDVYKNGKIVDHEGAWIAEGKNKPGLMMPGKIVIGDKFYQEIAPGVAMDRAEIISTIENLKTPAGNFKNCLKTEETTPLSPKEKEYKMYAAGIGLIRDGNLLLVKHGFVK